MGLFLSKKQLWEFFRDRQIVADQVERIAPRLEPFIRIARGEPYALKPAHEICREDLMEAVAQATGRSVDNIVCVSLTAQSPIEDAQMTVLPWNEETRRDFGITLRDEICMRFRVRHEDIPDLQGKIQALQERISHPERLRAIVWRNIASTLYAYLGSHLKRDHRRAAELADVVSRLLTSTPLARSKTDETRYYVLAA